MRQILRHGIWPLLAAVLLFQPVAYSATPLVPVPANALPSLQDDLDRKGLKQAIDASLAYLSSRPADASISLAGQHIPVSRLADSLVAFQKLLTGTASGPELAEQIKQQFIFFQAAGSNGFNPDRTMLVTGYFQPVVDGSLTRQPPYLYPLYTVPPDLIIQAGDRTNQKKIGRLDNGHFTDYWTRQEIDSQGKAAGSELVWLKDPLDVFFLQVQGSGLIRLRDQTVRGVHFAAKNGHPYRSIGKYMVQTGRISLQEASLATIRRYITNHPAELQEILFTNPSYIFFNWSDGYGATGNIGVDLTPGRSIAADQSCFPSAGLAFLKSRQPVIQSGKIVGWKPIHRFVLIQDSGSAIRGPGRVDLFWGTGDQAALHAGSMKEAGTLYFLLLRSDRP